MATILDDAANGRPWHCASRAAPRRALSAELPDRLAALDDLLHQPARDVLVADSSYPEFWITAITPTFRLSRLGWLMALFSLVLSGLGRSAGRDNREGVEEREERVGGLVSAGWGADRGGPVDRFLFAVLVGVLVDVGGLDAFVRCI
jgi:hypothetical protein